MEKEIIKLHEEKIEEVEGIGFSKSWRVLLEGLDIRFSDRCDYVMNSNSMYSDTISHYEEKLVKSNIKVYVEPFNNWNWLNSNIFENTLTVHEIIIDDISVSNANLYISKKKFLDMLYDLNRTFCIAVDSEEVKTNRYIEFMNLNRHIYYTSNADYSYSMKIEFICEELSYRKKEQDDKEASNIIEF